MPDVRNLLQKLHDDGVKVKFVELYCGRNVTVLNIRFVNQPFGQILSELRNWFDKILSGAEKAWQIWLQDHAESLPFYPENAPALNYNFAQFDVEMPYKPGDFTQINAQLNEVMVARAVRLLNPQKGERIADLFAVWAISVCRWRKVVHRLSVLKALIIWLIGQGKMPA